MTFIDRLVAQWKASRLEWLEILARFKSGEAKTTEQLLGCAQIDTTDASIADCERHIAELDDLIARHSDAK